MRRFFVPNSQIHQSHAIVSGEEFHHLCHVLRLRVGDHVSLQDDTGQEHHGVIAAMTATTADITILNTAPSISTHIPLTLALGLLKGQKMDLVIEKATELGVDRIVPFISTFTVSQLPTERLNDRLSRWQRIAQSAAKQSGNSIPQILAPLTFEQVCTAQLPATTTLLFYEREQQATLKRFANDHPRISALCVIVGPEGGFASEEVEQARRQGAHILGLGSTILRAETASMVAVALCRFLWDEATVPPLLQREGMP
jgi:16S rRNA (uracil1498-N3)-methyltransferase